MPRYFASLLSVLLFLALAGIVRAAPPAQTVLHLLDYIAVDYAEAVADVKIKNADEYQEMREFANQARAFIQDLPVNAAQPQLLADSMELVRRRDWCVANSNAWRLPDGADACRASVRNRRHRIRSLVGRP